MSRPKTIEQAAAEAAMEFKSRAHIKNKNKLEKVKKRPVVEAISIAHEEKVETRDEFL